ncbi:hypothetical protein ACFC14_06930 [Microbacterium sp. NPDC055988]|uniref:hypothetical protein n=1 Tax=Microbacterium sp. NPDC055988 TaxID=3345671 RepID=UPI0035D8057A
MTKDLPEDEPADEKMRRLVMDGVTSGHGSEVDHAYFDRLRTQTLPTKSGPLTNAPVLDTMPTAEVLRDLRADSV